MSDRTTQRFRLSGLLSLWASRRRSSSSEAGLNVIQIPPPHVHSRRHHRPSSSTRQMRSFTSCWSPLTLRSHRLRNSMNATPLSARQLMDEPPRSNLLAALASLMVITIMCTAVVQPRWFSFSSGICSRRYIGLQEFMYVRPIAQGSKTMQQLAIRTHRTLPHATRPGIPLLADEYPSNNKFNIMPVGLEETSGIKVPSSDKETSNESGTNVLPPMRMVADSNNAHTRWQQTANALRMMADHYEWQLNACIPPQVLHLQRTIITLCFLVMLLNLSQLMLDSMSIRNRYLDQLRRLAIFNIAGVLICVFIIGLSYMISNILAEDQMQRQIQNDRLWQQTHGVAYSAHMGEPSGQRVEINFELSYYLISLAGMLGLLAAALNLFSRRITSYESNRLSDIEASQLLAADMYMPNSLWIPPVVDSVPATFFAAPPPPPYSA